MARPPITMSPDALAELERQIGPRGSTNAQVATRAYFRRWLTGNGVASAVATVLTLSQLSEAYNDTTGAALEQLCKLPVGGESETPETEAPEPPPTPLRLDLPPVRPVSNARPLPPMVHPEAPKPAPSSPAPTPQAASPDAAAQLAALIGQLAAQSAPAAAPLDENRVLELIRANAAKPDHFTVTVRPGKVLEPVTLDQAPRHAIFPRALRAIGAGENLMLVGPAGSGKTTIAEQIATALKLDFYMTGAVDSPYKLTGFRDAQGRYEPTAFRRAFERGGLFLFDEIDASSPQALLTFNAQLANGYGDFPDGMVKRHADFRCIAAANTYGSGRDRQYVGRNQLDAASKDRFVYLAMDYDPKLERMLAGSDPVAEAWCAYVQAVRTSTRLLKILHVVSPRATLQGIRLLAAGDLLSDVIDSAVWRGLDPDQAEKVSGQSAVRDARAALGRAIRAAEASTKREAA